MKLIHCGDLHLGSPISSRLPRDKALRRKEELRTALRRMVDFARSQEICLVLLCGDVFDSERPGKKDKDFFYSVVKNNPDMDFIYLRGNHDRLGGYVQELPNLKTFSNQWQCYRYEDVAIWGMEMDSSNASTMYASLNLSSEQTNLVMLHGQLGDCPGDGRIWLAGLREKNIDYLALGHVHSFGRGSLDSRGSWCYCGCLEGRGYDECGPKGFVVLDTQDISHPEFVSQPIRTIHRVEVPVTGCADIYQVLRQVEECLPESTQDLLRLELTGQLSWDSSDLARELETQLAGRYFALSVKNRIQPSFDLEALAGEISLAGEFIRQVLAAEGLTQEERRQVAELGLRVLAGQEVGL